MWKRWPVSIFVIVQQVLGKRQKIVICLIIIKVFGITFIYVYLCILCITVRVKPKLLKEKSNIFFSGSLYPRVLENPPLLENFQLTLMTKLTTLKFDLLKDKIFQ